MRRRLGMPGLDQVGWYTFNCPPTPGTLSAARGWYILGARRGDKTSSEYKPLENLHNDLQPGSGDWHVGFRANTKGELASTVMNILGLNQDQSHFASPATDPSRFDSQQLASQPRSQYESAILSEAGAYEFASGIDGSGLQDEALRAGSWEKYHPGDDGRMDYMTKDALINQINRVVFYYSAEIQGRSLSLSGFRSPLGASGSLRTRLRETLRPLQA